MGSLLKWIGLPVVDAREQLRSVVIAMGMPALATAVFLVLWSVSAARV